MRVAILTSTLSQYSGIDRVVIDQAKSFTLNGHQVTVFALSSDVEIPDTKIIILGMPKSLFLQRIYRLLFFLDTKKIKKYSHILKEFDTIYSHQYPMNLIAQQAKKKYGIEYIYYNHGIAPPNVFNSIFEKLYIWMFIKFSNQSIRFADKAISISKYLSSVLKEDTGIASEVRLNTIDTQRFNHNVSAGKVRDKYQLGGKPVVLYVGRISPHKGIHLLIEAFNKAVQQVPEAQLLIVGKETFSTYGKK